MQETIEPMEPLAAADAGVGEAATLEMRLTAFFGDHYERMTRLAGLICHSSAVPEDAVQAAMEQAWRRRSSLRDPERMRWWLDRIVVREAIRMNRRGRSPWSSLSSVDEQTRLLPDPAREMTAERLALVAAFRALTAEQRAACVLHLHLGYGVAETARLMGASFETTRSRLRLARQRLRADLSEDRS